MKGKIATVLFVMMAFCVGTAQAKEDFPFELLIPILAQSACTESKLQNCNNAESCMYSKGYWYNGKCNATRYNGTDKHYIIFTNNLVNYSPGHNIKYNGNITGYFQTRYTIFGDYVCINSPVDAQGSGGMYISKSPYFDEALPPLIEQTNIVNIGAFTSSVDFGLSQNGDGTKVLHYTSEDDYYINYPNGVISNKSPYFVGSAWSYSYSEWPVDYKASYRILGKEVISTPLGKFECFKVYYKYSKILGSGYTESGYVWVYPPIGVIKSSVSVVDEWTTLTPCKNIYSLNYLVQSTNLFNSHFPMN